MICFHYGHTKSPAELDKQQQWTVCSREHSWKGGKAYLSSLLSLLPLICKWKCQTQNSAAITWKFINQLKEHRFQLRYFHLFWPYVSCPYIDKHLGTHWNSVPGSTSAWNNQTSSACCSMISDYVIFGHQVHRLSNKNNVW